MENSKIGFKKLIPYCIGPSIGITISISHLSVLDLLHCKNKPSTVLFQIQYHQARQTPLTGIMMLI